MQLNVFERLVLLNTLPREGDYTTLKLLRKLKEELSFSEKEHEELQFANDGGNGRIKWRTEADRSKEIEIGSKMKEVITDSLQELDKSCKLTEEHLGIYEKFVDEGKDS